MQKVVGSSPIIRSENPCKSSSFVVRTVNGVCRVARFALAMGAGTCEIAATPARSWHQWWKPLDTKALQIKESVSNALFTSGGPQAS
jgi:hypothetical protein